MKYQSIVLIAFMNLVLATGEDAQSSLIKDSTSTIASSITPSETGVLVQPLADVTMPAESISSILSPTVRFEDDDGAATSSAGGTTVAGLDTRFPTPSELVGSYPYPVATELSWNTALLKITRDSDGRIASILGQLQGKTPSKEVVQVAKDAFAMAFAFGGVVRLTKEGFVYNGNQAHDPDSSYWMIMHGQKQDKSDVSMGVCVYGHSPNVPDAFYLSKNSTKPHHKNSISSLKFIAGGLARLVQHRNPLFIEFAAQNPTFKDMNIDNFIALYPEVVQWQLGLLFKQKDGAKNKYPPYVMLRFISKKILTRGEFYTDGSQAFIAECERRLGHAQANHESTSFVEMCDKGQTLLVRQKVNGVKNAYLIPVISSISLADPHISQAVADKVYRNLQIPERGNSVAVGPTSIGFVNDTNFHLVERSGGRAKANQEALQIIADRLVGLVPSRG